MEEVQAKMKKQTTKVGRKLVIPYLNRLPGLVEQAEDVSDGGLMLEEGDVTLANDGARPLPVAKQLHHEHTAGILRIDRT